jgi:putative transposase
MQYRKDPLAVGETYHVFSKSISGLTIFNDRTEYLRMLEALPYYQKGKPPIKLSKTMRYAPDHWQSLRKIQRDGAPALVRILCYCLMPTHLHLVMKQLVEHGISEFMGLVLNSYSRYFNTKHHRKGPLWEGRFKDVRAGTDEQLLHLTRYIHLNPVTAYLVDKPEKWEASSYREYLGESENRICDIRGVVTIDPSRYRLFVGDRADYQRRLGDIKRLLHEEPCAPWQWE